MLTSAVILAGSKSAEKNNGGFTLIEILIAVALLVLLGATAIPLLQFQLDKDSEEVAKEMAILMRQARDDAMFRHATIRIVFEMPLEENHKFWPQSTTSKVLLMEDVDEDRLSRKELELLEEKVKNRNSKFQDDPSLADKSELPRDIQIAWVKNEPNKFTDEGFAFIHFFPSGQAEAGEIKVIDDGGNAYLITINPITGRVTLEATSYEEDEKNEAS